MERTIRYPLLMKLSSNAERGGRWSRISKNVGRFIGTQGGAELGSIPGAALIAATGSGLGVPLIVAGSLAGSIAGRKLGNYATEFEPDTSTAGKNL